MQKISTHLWFDKEAKQAADFYVSVFGNAKITSSSVLHNTPSGNVDVINMTILGQDFTFISAGPYFKVNPSISFMLDFDPSKNPDARQSLDELWGKLSDGGKVLMELQEYPFSKWYGWIQDKYGVSWQLILTEPGGDERQTLIPSLLFVGDVCGKAEEAIQFYVSVFKNSKLGGLMRYGAGAEPNKENSLAYADFKLENHWFIAMDSALKHEFSFSEAVSFVVRCKNQQEIDYYWERLSAVPESEQCGWLKDKYGVSWQIVPDELDEMMSKGNPEQIARVTEAFLKMKRFDLAELRRAYGN